MKFNVEAVAFFDPHGRVEKWTLQFEDLPVYSAVLFLKFFTTRYTYNSLVFIPQSFILTNSSKASADGTLHQNHPRSRSNLGHPAGQQGASLWWISQVKRRNFDLVLKLDSELAVHTC